VGPPRVNEAARPAFYSLAPGGWRDYVTLLHPPYTAWHLSYVVIGAALAPQWRPGILGLALAAFFLGMGVGAHALDELHGRPLQTRIGPATRVALAFISLLAAAALGIATALETNLWLLAFVGAGAFIAVAYNLELFGGRFHGTLWFALAWGALPVLATFFAAAGAIRAEAALAAAFAALVSWVQRVLSTPVRMVRRQVRNVSGRIELADGRELPVTRDTLSHAPETALRLLPAAMVALAVALVLLRVT
jgi:MFS family permease